MKMAVECPACKGKVTVEILGGEASVQAKCERPRGDAAAEQAWESKHEDAYGSSDYVFVPEEGLLAAL